MGRTVGIGIQDFAKIWEGDSTRRIFAATGSLSGAKKY